MSRVRARRRFLLGGLGLLLAAGLVVILMNRWAIPGWMEKRLSAEIRHQLERFIPLEIVKFDLSSSSLSFFGDSVFHLHVIFASPPYKIHIEGPLTASWKKQDKYIELTFAPEVKLEGTTFSDPLKINFAAKSTLNFEEALSAEIEIKQESWNWEEERVAVAKPYMGVVWNHGLNDLLAQFSFESLEASDATDTNTILINQFQLVTHAPLKEERVTVRTSTASLEMLLGEDLYEIPLEKWSLDLEAKLNLKEETVTDFSTMLYHREQPQIQLQLDPRPAVGLPPNYAWPQNVNVSWMTFPLEVAPFAELARSIFSHNYDIPSGTLTTSGAAKINLKDSFSPKSISHIDGDVELEDMTLRNKDQHLNVEGLKVVFPLKFKHRGKVVLEADRFAWRRFEAGFRLPGGTFELRPELEYSFHFPKGIEWKGEGLPFKLGRVSGKGDWQSFEALTSLQVEPIELTDLAYRACMKSRLIPPAELNAEFSEVVLANDRIKLTGQGGINLFEGKAVLKNLKIFRPLARVPEIQFDLTWDDIRLQPLGEWLQFGRMDGLFEGYAKQVVLQRTLPTQFNVLMKVKPYSQDKVEFSTLAMKNFVQLISGDEFEKNLPGIGRWFAFGLPSRLLGGYDVDYAGVSVYSSGKSILLETLDSQGTSGFRKKHYLLHGPRLKMPLNSHRYPLVLDGPGMAAFVRDLMTRLSKIKSGDGPVKSSLSAGGQTKEGEEDEICGPE